MATLAERLDRRLDKSGECWLWTGYITSWGYGTIRDENGVKIPAHRAAWQVANGPIPEGMSVLHECDVRPCCNPVHLHLGTHIDNMREVCERERGTLGESDKHAKLTESQVRAIRAQWDAGDVIQKDIAREYGITRSAVGYIVRRDTWRHI